MSTFIKSLRITCLILFVPFLTFGQQTDLDINRTIELSGTTSEERIVINVEPGTSHLDLNIRSIIDQGKLRVEIIDPNGEKQGSLSAESQITPGDDKKEMVEGRLNKRAKDPIPGEWVVVLKTMSAYGRIRLTTRMANPETTK